MRNSRHNPGDEDWSESGSHDKFLELCALSTSGELSEEEQKGLREHLANCFDCRLALNEFEAAATIGMPLLLSKLAGSELSEPDVHRRDVHKRASIITTAHVEASPKEQPLSEANIVLEHPKRSGHRATGVNWNYVWMTSAAALILTVALSIYSFQLGKQKRQPVMRSTADAFDRRAELLEQQISDLGHDREVLRTQLRRRDRLIATMRRQITEQLSALAEAKNSEARLENSLEDSQVQKQQVIQERSDVLQKLDGAQASLQKTQAELDSLQQERSQDEARDGSLEAQIRDLHGQLRDREQQLREQNQLLAHDRDIRELMGARDLYIAEVFDVARDGQTQKPYGRVFYTKGKSLIFYAYDLDQQAGLKSVTTFQAWGTHGLDRQQATSLGVFYQDNAAKKRWVVKFDDPKKLEQIDAVFVTVEPKGGSQKPSGKQLLFASLAVEANHP